ncbi:ABC transporter ATP-binding protein [Paraburkholderia tropica]|uniref:ABC transporter ATP-binding protein n=1 Tax=Paraburkholderia tropica TaxID=92647 RepID=UPI002AB7DD33|nr:ABC transporter ATP-binding protein [Paraburkholderia tropica]
MSTLSQARMGDRLSVSESRGQSDLALSGLTRKYGESVAVDSLTLRINSGELIALLGPSGCGKSTTLRMIAGLIEPTSGDVLVGGRRITNVPAHKRNIGMLFQSYALFPHLTIADNIAFGLEMRSMDRAQRKEKVDDALALIKMSEYGKRYPSELSGGQQQRVALARAIVVEPALLLLDEPMGALDKHLREDMQMEIRRIQQRLGITTVMVTHDQDEAMTMADRIVIMRAGRIEQSGTPREVYRQPATAFVASFMGSSNIFSGEIVANKDGLARVEVPGGQIVVESGALAGHEITVSVRPEAVKLTAVRADERNALPLWENHVRGEVAQIRFRGQSTDITLRLANGKTFLAHLNEHSMMATALELHQEVVASWPRSEQWPLP